MKLKVLLAFLFSSLLAAGAAVLSDVLDTSVRDPEQIAALFQIDVMGSLPMVKSWRRRLAAGMPFAGETAALVRLEDYADSDKHGGLSGFEEPCALYAVRSFWVVSIGG